MRRTIAVLAVFACCAFALCGRPRRGEAMRMGIGLGIQRSSSASAVPPTISGLVLNARADSLVTFSGSNVTAWGDKSGNGNNLAAANTDPTFTASWTNGHPGITFGATSLTSTPSQLVCSTFSGGTIAQPVTIVWVGVAQPGTWEALVTGSPSAATFFFDSQNNAGDRLISIGCSSELTAYHLSSNYTIPHLFIGVFNGSSSALYIDGISVTTGNVGTGSLPGLLLGSIDSKSGSNWFGYNGTMGEIAVYSVAFSAGNISAWHAYAQLFWGTP